MNREEINKYSFWIKEIDRYPSFLDNLNPSIYEMEKCLDCIKEWKRPEAATINALLQLNPGMTLKEAKSEGYKQFERVEKIIQVRLKMPTDSIQKGNLKFFTWLGNDEQLKKLFDELIASDHGFIDPKTDFQAFTAIFTGKVDNNDLCPVKWIKRAQKSKAITKSAVIALFNILAESNKIPKSEIMNKANLFRKLQTWFIDPNGNPMKFEHGHLKYSKDCAALLNKIVISL
jgi:hypothetical protein